MATSVPLGTHLLPRSRTPNTHHILGPHCRVWLSSRGRIAAARSPQRANVCVLQHVSVPSVRIQHPVRGRPAGAAAAESFEIPPIDGDLTEAMLDSEAELDENGVAISFGDDARSLEAAQNGAALYNMSHFGRIRVSGDDKIRFLHNQTSADFQSLKPGQGCFTVFQTSTARTIELASAWIMERAVILTVSPNQKQKLMTMMDRYLFPADKVQLADITDKTCQLAIIGPASNQVLERLDISGLEGAPLGTLKHFNVDESPVTVIVGSGLATPGYTFLVAPDVAGKVWTTLVAIGVVPMGEQAWDCLRILDGRPAPGAELTEEYNPLEAGLWQAISTSKGCYIGQETIARLITYNGVKQNLWGIMFPSPVKAGTVLTNEEGAKIGKVTSCSELPVGGEFAALGYVKRSDPPATDGDQVFADSVEGTLCEVPFLARELQTVA